MLTQACATHAALYAGLCPFCVISQRQRDDRDVLDARQSDQAAEILALRRQVNELAGLVLDLQRAHNQLVNYTVLGQLP